MFGATLYVKMGITFAVRNANFHSLQYFATKLHNFTHFRMPFLAVLINFPNSKVYLIGNGFIHTLVTTPVRPQRAFVHGR